MKRIVMMMMVVAMVMMLAAGCADEATPEEEAAQIEMEVDALTAQAPPLVAASLRQTQDMTTVGLAMLDDARKQPQPSPIEKRIYMVVGETEAINAVEDLLVERERQGYFVRTASLERIKQVFNQYDTVPEQVRAALQEEEAFFQSENEVYLLLLGSHETIPFVWFETDPVDPYEYGVYTDGYYANLHSDFDSDGDGNLGEWGQDDYDLNRELHVGRVPLDNPAQIRAWARRVLNFEKDQSARMDESLLAGGYIAVEGDTAVAVSLVRELVLKPQGYDVTTMLEEHPYGDNYRFLQSDRTLDQDEFTDQLSNNEYGFVFWMSHGNHLGASTLNHGSFIYLTELDHLKAKPPTLYFSSACLQSFPAYGNNLGEQMMQTNATAFVASTGETYPGALGGGSLIFLVATHKVVVQSMPLAVGIDQARDVYIKNFWKLPYDRGTFLKNYFGFTVLGDPAMAYPNRG